MYIRGQETIPQAPTPFDYAEFNKLRDFERYLNEGLAWLRKQKPERE